MTETFRPLPYRTARLRPGLFKNRFEINRRFMLSLKTPNLLQNYYLEAGLWAPMGKPDDAHWGWESPTCQIRGQFLGHWLSAAAHLYANTGDQEIKGKADYMVAELARCQQENGGEWAGSIPEKYLDWLARGKRVHSPQCTVHRTMMGLYDMYARAGNQQALEILVRWAQWFQRWTAQFTQAHFDDMLDVETGGMLEAWANLYGATGDKAHYELMYRYYRRHLFDPLLAGKDVLTNMHANTTIPEAHGAARAWEVTGDERWRHVVEAYWRSAVVERGYYCTGGQTNGEFWSPPGQLSARLGDKTQEHCTVYNMMRLADYLLRWTGEAAYADYWERNLYNGTLAQQHPETGMVAYFLPLRSGSVKRWGTQTDDFWCCHGTLVQAQSLYLNHILYGEGDNLVLSQYIPCELELDHLGSRITLGLAEAADVQPAPRPVGRAYDLQVTCDPPREFAIKLRLPWWLVAQPRVVVNGNPQAVEPLPSPYARLHKTWNNDLVQIMLPHGVSVHPLPDLPDTVAFMEGPVVLAGVLGDATANTGSRTLVEKTLAGETDAAASLLIPDNEREFTHWRTSYRTVGQSQNLRFIPLYDIRDESYAVYFPIQGRSRIK